MNLDPQSRTRNFPFVRTLDLSCKINISENPKLPPVKGKCLSNI